jgi:hypothetical protein
MKLEHADLISKNAVLKVNMEDLDKRSKTPILTYCRKLIKLGYAPEIKLHVFRENHSDPDVIVNSIGDAAKLTVKETPLLSPTFVKFEDKGHLTKYDKKNKLEEGA